MHKQLFKDAVSWGFVLWLIGYILGIVLFAAVPPAMLGWVIMPIGIIITLWVLIKKVKNESIALFDELSDSEMNDMGNDPDIQAELIRLKEIINELNLEDEKKIEAFPSWNEFVSKAVEYGLRV